MKHPETYLVTSENGVCPDGPRDACLYCRQPLGREHLADCPCRKRSIVIRILAQLCLMESECSTAEFIEFRFNESSRCADNTLERLSRLAKERGCLCGILKHKFLREASVQDEATLMPKMEKTQRIIE